MIKNLVKKVVNNWIWVLVIVIIAPIIGFYNDIVQLFQKKEKNGIKYETQINNNQNRYLLDQSKQEETNNSSNNHTDQSNSNSPQTNNISGGIVTINNFPNPNIDNRSNSENGKMISDSLLINDEKIESEYFLTPYIEKDDKYSYIGYSTSEILDFNTIRIKIPFNCKNINDVYCLRVIIEPRNKTDFETIDNMYKPNNGVNIILMNDDFINGIYTIRYGYMLNKDVNNKRFIVYQKSDKPKYFDFNRMLKKNIY